MIRHNVSLDSSGRARLDNKAHELDLGYTSNRNVYALNVLAGPEWAGLAIRAFWHTSGGTDPPASLVVDGSVIVPARVTAKPGTGCITFEGTDGGQADRKCGCALQGGQQQRHRGRHHA